MVRLIKKWLSISLAAIISSSFPLLGDVLIERAKAASVTVISQGFSGNPVPDTPSGWILNGIDSVYNAAGDSGVSNPALKLEDNGDSVTTSTFANGSALSFWVKGKGTMTDSTVSVEYLPSGGTWTALGTINPIPTSGTTELFSLVDGTTRLRFTFNNASTGNLAFDDVLVTYNDVTAPQITGVADGGSYNDDRTITVTDDYQVDSILLNGNPFISGSIVSDPGDYTLVATDAAGNSSTISFEIESVLSAPVLISPADNIFTNSPTIELDWSDSDGGEDNPEYAVIVDGLSVDSELSESSYSLDISEMNEGSHTWQVSATDGATSPTSDVRNFYIDRSAPVTTDNIDGLWHNNSFDVNLTCDDGLGAGCSTTYYSVNGAPFLEGNSFTVTNPGASIISYYSVDALGNGGEVSVTTAANQVLIDSTDPYSTIDSLPFYGPYSWSNLIRGTAVDPSDASGVDHVNVKVTDPEGRIYNGISFEAESNGVDTDVNPDGTWSIDLPLVHLTPSGEGTYSIKTVAFDNVGREESDAFATFVFDQTAPSIPTATPSGGNYQSAQSVALESTDGSSGVDKIYFTTDGTIPDNTKNPYSSKIEIASDTVLRSIAYDQAGNFSDAMLERYNIAPVISAENALSITDTSATIVWDTNQPATSRVIFDTINHPTAVGTPGSNYGYAYSTLEDTALVIHHSVTVTGLNPDTTYYFRTVSHGSPESVSQEKTFKTATKPDQPVSVVTASSSSDVAIVNAESDASQELEVQENQIRRSPETFSTATPTDTPAAPEVKGEATQNRPNYWLWILIAVLVVSVGAAGYIYYKANQE